MFIATLFVITKFGMGSAQMSFNRRAVTQTVVYQVYLYQEILLGNEKKNKLLMHTI